MSLLPRTGGLLQVLMQCKVKSVISKVAWPYVCSQDVEAIILDQGRARVRGYANYVEEFGI